jgi:ankyrin repeat protein
LLLILAAVLLVAFLGWLLARLIKSIRHESIWWRQLLLIVAGVLLVAFVGSLLHSPTGPGSGRIPLALLAAYALLLLLLGPKFTKITGLVLLCIFLAAFAIETRDSYKSPEQRRLDSMLFTAVAKGDIAGAKYALARGADLNSEQKYQDLSIISSVAVFYSWNPVHVAAKRRRIRKKMVELLIDEGAKVNAKDERGRTPLFWACAGYYWIPNDWSWRAWERGFVAGQGSMKISSKIRNDFKETVELLIARGAQINSADRKGATPLHATAVSGQKEIAALLIIKGAKVNARTKMDETPLHWAAEAGRKEIVELLIANGAHVNLVTKLPKYQWREYRGHTALYYALEEGHKEVAEFLQKYGAKLSQEEQARIDKLLVINVGSGDFDRVKHLLDKGANPSGRVGPNGDFPLYATAATGNREMAEFLIAAGADVNAHRTAGWTALHRAAYRGNIEVAKLLIENGANVNAVDDDGLVPLWRVAFARRVDIMKLLIANGANVNVTDKQGKSLIQEVKRRGHKEVIDLLRKAGALE